SVKRNFLFRSTISVGNFRRQNSRRPVRSKPTLQICSHGLTRWATVRCTIPDMRKPLLMALSLLGLFISIYLWWVYSSPSHALVCLGTGTGCDTVRASRYADILGLPMPIYGVAMYVTLALLLFAEHLIATQFARRVRYAFTAIAAAGFLFSLYLTALEAFVIHAWCAWCVGSAVAFTFIFGLTALETIRTARRPHGTAPPHTP